MNVSFDPRNIVALDDKGTVYPNIRVTDKWGILVVKEGALMSRNWDKITVTVPKEIKGNNIKGEGWELELNESYMVTKDDSTGHYNLRKK
jgi:hypothetical protein